MRIPTCSMANQIYISQVAGCGLLEEFRLSIRGLPACLPAVLLNANHCLEPFAGVKTREAEVEGSFGAGGDVKTIVSSYNNIIDPS
jgi:hypothetical protein